MSLDGEEAHERNRNMDVLRLIFEYKFFSTRCARHSCASPRFCPVSSTKTQHKDHMLTTAAVFGPKTYDGPIENSVHRSQVVSHLEMRTELSVVEEAERAEQREIYIWLERVV